jgi:hypothetical protein
MHGLSGGRQRAMSEDETQSGESAQEMSLESDHALVFGKDFDLGFLVEDNVYIPRPQI